MATSDDGKLIEGTEPLNSLEKQVRKEEYHEIINTGIKEEFREPKPETNTGIKDNPNNLFDLNNVWDEKHEELIILHALLDFTIDQSGYHKFLQLKKAKANIEDRILEYIKSEAERHDPYHESTTATAINIDDIEKRHFIKEMFIAMFAQGQHGIEYCWKEAIKAWDSKPAGL